MNLSVCKSSECGSTVAMRTSAPEISQSQNSSSSSGQCFSNPSYHTVAQCNVVSTISSNLDGTLTLKVWTPSKSSHKISKLHAAVQNQHYIVFFFSQSNTLKSRNGSEWRAYCNLNDLGQFSSLPYYIAVRRSGIWTLQSQQFKGKRHTCRSHTPFIGANLLWMKTRGLLLDITLDITFALILIRYAAKAVVRRWIGVTMSSLVLFHFPWWHIFLWRLTLGQTLHSHRLWTIEN